MNVTPYAGKKVVWSQVLRRTEGRSRWRLSVCLLAVGLLVAGYLTPPPLQADTLTVTTLNDAGPGSLRQALSDAASGDTITFTVTGTIATSSTLPITKNLTIAGPGAAQLRIAGDSTDYRVFFVSGTTATIDGVTISGGGGLFEDGCFAGNGGGGIRNAPSATLTLSNSVVSESYGYCNGGGISNGGTMTVSNSTITSNFAFGYDFSGYATAGGGIFNSGTMIVRNSTIAGNWAYYNDYDFGGGGGIYNRGLMTVHNSTITSSEGGGIQNGGRMTVYNSTIAYNNANTHSSFRDGGISNVADPFSSFPRILDVSFSTIIGNSGGIANGDSLTSGEGISIKNSIVAHNGSECTSLSGTFTALGVNFSIDGGFYGCSLTNVSPAQLNLGPLAPNGGPTQTVALLPSSIALNAAPDCTDVAGQPVTTDQRGTPRPQDAVCDVGAFEALSSNHAPVADAGPDQTVDEDTMVTLDGSGSADPDGTALTAHWTQIAGSPVTLVNATTLLPTFTAPSVAVGGETLTFQLTVSDGLLTSPADVVNITVKNVNHAPVADAGTPQTVQEGSPVTLNGTSSHDPDSDALTFTWLQTAGPTVSLTAANTAQPSFMAPLVGPAGATLTFTLTVSDGPASASASVTVLVENVNHAPTANAGPDQTRTAGSPVTLTGAASSDPDGDALTFTWTQTAGPQVNLDLTDPVHPTFIAPPVSLGGALLVFQLVVSDGLAPSDPADTVIITVLHRNDPPMCHLAVPSPAVLWPPNHTLVPVQVVGVSDPNHDPVTLTVTGVTQDEPLNGLGDGDTSPDATVQGGQLFLRAERAGTGNGRVYQVRCTADDGQGGVCTGSVKVCVPHDQDHGNACLDDGQQFSSF